jgi:hypothetical protein
MYIGYQRLLVLCICGLLMCDCNVYLEGNTYNIGGNYPLTVAKKKAERGNWRAAAEIWRQLVAQHENDKIVGKAAFNLSITCALMERYELALRWAQIAHQKLDTLKTHQYLNRLNRVREDNVRMAVINY